MKPVFDAAPNATFEQRISLRDKLPDLAPGLYLMIADAANDTDKPADKGLAPLAALWFTKSDFTLQAVRDNDGTHVFASTATAAKNNIHLIATGRQSEQIAEAQTNADGLGLIAGNADIISVIGTDAAGNVAFADVKPLPAPVSPRSPGMMISADPFTPPTDAVNLSLSLATGADPALAAPSFVRLTHHQDFYADFRCRLWPKTLPRFLSLRP